MFRLRLAAVIAVSFSLVLLLGWMFYWGGGQVSLNFRRSLSAYEAFEHYQRLSQEAYRYFKQRMDRLATDKDDAGLAESKWRLRAAMEALRGQAIQNQDGTSEQDKAAELERVARFTAFLDASEYRFDEMERLRRQGKQGLAASALAKFSREEIDEKFQPLIDAATEAERKEAEAARESVEALILESRWVAFLAAAVVALFSLGAGILLLGSVRKPIEALLQGTDHIAAGRLDYRIPVLTRDEFGQLASHFNQMAGELQRQQDNLRESHAVLERRVAERTLELNQLNEELQQRDTERREFLADISHELRTPITVIRGEAEVTLRGPLREAEEYREALLRVADLSEQLGKYVNDLMVIARADNACLQFEWSRVDLAGLVSCAVEDIRVMAEEYLVSVWLDLPAATPVWVWADKERLRQVLFILGDNACRYSKAGGHIALDLKVEAGQALFSISDLGIGIPAKDLGRVFDRHFRSTNARLVRGDGSGLGLPLAKSIIQAHEGQISVTSVENAGTTFLVSLPLSLSEESVSERTRA